MRITTFVVASMLVASASMRADSRKIDFTGDTVGAFANDSGSYEIQGLRAGPWVVRVNPITDPTSPGDFGFPDDTDLDYRDALYTGGPVEVEASSSVRSIDVAVTP